MFLQTDKFPDKVAAGSILVSCLTCHVHSDGMCGNSQSSMDAAIACFRKKDTNDDLSPSTTGREARCLRQCSGVEKCIRLTDVTLWKCPGSQVNSRATTLLEHQRQLRSLFIMVSAKVRTDPRPPLDGYNLTIITLGCIDCPA